MNDCDICDGKSPALGGTENVLHGATVCDYCTVKYRDLQSLIKTSLDLEENDAHAVNDFSGIAAIIILFNSKQICQIINNG